MGSPPEAWSVVAHNTATQSQNKIHDDAVARRFGFRGGLVPGVDDYAYLAHVPAATWGLAWLERGTLAARFHEPVYEGETVEVRPGQIEHGEGLASMSLELLGPEGTVRATATATLADEALAVPEPVRAVPLAALPDEPPEASPVSLAEGSRFTLPARPVDPSDQGTYLTDVRETLPLFGEHQVAHPGWLLRLANRILAGSVALGPWIHVSSDVRHLSLARYGESVGARSVVTAEWERKGHRFVTLTVDLVAPSGDTERPVATIGHTAIYRPRR